MKTHHVLVLLLTASPAMAASRADAAPVVGAQNKGLADTLTGDAKAEYDAARALYQNRDFQGALLKFRRAHELSPDPRLFWNMAACEKNLGHYVKGLKLVDSYLSSAGALVTEEDRRQAAEYQARTRLLVSKVTLSLKEQDVAVFVDDERIGVTPLSLPLLVDVGERRFRFSKPGFSEKTIKQEIAGGTELALAVELERDAHEARVAVSAGPNEEIALDDKFVGKEKWSGTVASGPHAVTVSAPGRKARRIDLTLADNDRRELSVTLEPSPSFLGSNWPWLAGGAAVVAGGVIGGYFLLRPRTPDLRQGTLQGYQVP